MPADKDLTTPVTTRLRAAPLGKPAPRDNLGAEVARYLREAVMAGRYGPGERLRIEDLAGELEVSSMPVREALLTLANEGLLEVRPRRGFRVAETSLQDAEDVYSVHAYLAGRLAERAATKMSDERIAALRTLQQQLEEAAAAHEPTAVIEQLNYEFHRQINRCAESPRLEWFLRAANRYVPRRFYEDIPEWTQTSIDDHPAIIEALEHRDGARAHELMEQHVERAGRLVVQALKARGWPGRRREED